MQSSPLWSRVSKSELNRRKFLTGTGAALVGASALPLVGCGDDDDDDDTGGNGGGGTTPSATQPSTGNTPEPGKQGGTWNRGAGNNIALASLPFQEAGTLAGGGNAAAAAGGLVWGNLVRMAEDKLEWEPDHAKEWEISSDKKTLKLVLRDDISYHSGRKFTTKDVGFNLDQLNNDKWKSAATYNFNPVTSYNIIDDYTMEWTLSADVPTVMEFMSLFRLADMDTFDEITTGKLIGTGAFKWIDFDPVRGASLEAYEGYHLGRPLLDKIEYTIFADAAALAIALETGAIDDSALSAEEAERFYDNKDFETVKLPPGGGMTPITFRTDLDPLTDARTRQAIGYLLDRERYQEENFVGRFDELGRLPWPSFSPAYDAELDKPIYDPQRAKDILREAGFPNGLPSPVKINTLPVRAYSSAIAQLLQQEGREVGINFEFVPLEYNAMLDRFYQGTMDNMWVGFGDSGSPLSPAAQVRISATIGNDRIHHYTDPAWVAARDAIAAGGEDYATFNKEYLDGTFQLPLARSVGVNFESSRVHIVRNFLGGVVYHKTWVS